MQPPHMSGVTISSAVCLQSPSSLAATMVQSKCRLHTELYSYLNTCISLLEVADVIFGYYEGPK